MSEIIQDSMYVDLTYKVIDQESGDVLVAVEFPIGYVHGVNDILAPAVTEELEGKSVGDVIEVPIDCDQIYGSRDEELVFTDYIENVPEEYREIGITIHTENEKGEPRGFIVTRMDEKTLTVDGNNPLSGRKVIFKLEILNVRGATDEEIEAGGPIGVAPDIDEALTVPLQ
ncbi:MAG: peptidylprolyl isomerase [Rhodospirillales bacterium]|nr:peptidylprolyl isomerase [Rhodospirillales bacterium]